MSFTCEQAIPYQLAAMGAQTRGQLELWCKQQATNYTPGYFEMAMFRLTSSNTLTAEYYEGDENSNQQPFVAYDLR